MNQILLYEQIMKLDCLQGTRIDISYFNRETSIHIEKMDVLDGRLMFSG